MRMFASNNPERLASAIVIGRLRRAGFEDVQPAGDDMGLLIGLELGFGQPDGLLPVVVDEAKHVFAKTWLDRSGVAWPFTLEASDSSMLGSRLRYVGDDDGLLLAMVCIVGVVDRWIANSPTMPPLLTFDLGNE